MVDNASASRSDLVDERLICILFSAEAPSQGCGFRV
jgi:hypothetical protein